MSVAPRPQINGGPESSDAPSKEYESAHEGERVRKPSWQTTIESFTPVWFTLSMNTGIIGILMWNLPYQFNGLHIIATIMYVFNIIIFAAAMIMTILRWTLFPKAASRKVLASFDELCMHGTIPIAFLTLAGLTALIPSSAFWGHHAFTLVAYVMWWIATAWMITTCVVVNMTLFRTDLASVGTMSTTMFLPAVGLSTDAVIGALICRYSYGISARLAVPVLIVSYMLNGLALWISIVIYTLYTHHLMKVGFPDSAKTPSLWLLVGPYGQTGAAFIILGSSAQSRMQFADYHKGTFLEMSGAMSASGVGVILGLLLLGFDFFWICISTWKTLEDLFKRKTSYSLLWWSTIFPLGTVATTCFALSVAMDSPAFRGLTAAILLFLVIDYLLNWAFTLHRVITGDMLIKPPEDVVTEQRKGD